MSQFGFPNQNQNPNFGPNQPPPGHKKPMSRRAKAWIIVGCVFAGLIIIIPLATSNRHPRPTAVLQPISSNNIFQESPTIEPTMTPTPTPTPTPSPVPTLSKEELQKIRIDVRKNFIKLDYKKYARNPDTYPDSQVMFKGKVIQSMEDGNNYIFRIAVNNSYSQIVWVEYTNKYPEDGRILENDTVTVYAFCNGLKTYESTLGGSITIPAFIGSDIVVK